MNRRLSVDGVDYDVSSAPARAHHGDGPPATVVTVTAPSTGVSTVEVRVLDATTREITATDRSWRRIVHTVHDGDQQWVFCNGRVFEIPAGSTVNRTASPPTGGALEAPMPATVASVLVQPGQTVRQGDTLLVLEAMKMELPLRAPNDGVVGTVRCQPGDLVQPGVVLVDLADPALSGPEGEAGLPV